MWRDVLLPKEMIQAAVQAVALVEGVSVEHLAADRIRCDAQLWNFPCSAKPLHSSRMS
jgi:hypothetical protein